MGKANLTYYIFEGVLVGSVNGRFVHMFVHSGGGGGTKNPAGPSEPDAVNNVYRTGQKTEPARNLRGGPIPLGKYIIRKPAPWHNGRAARLEPTNPLDFQKATGGRSDFLIHGRGPLGSDGCLVPLNRAEFAGLMDGLEKDGGGTLWVLQAMGGAMFA